MKGVTVEMLMDDWPVKKISYQGKTFIPVEIGREFKIRVRNRTNHDICAVVSVDGLSVMNGQEADHNGSGYIVPARDTVVINGWRRGDHEVACFEIGEQGTSYAEKKKDVSSANRGVIGVAVFPQKRRNPPKRKVINRGDDGIRCPFGGTTSGACCSFDSDATTLLGCMSTPTRETETLELTAGGIELPVKAQNAGTVYGRLKADHAYQVNFYRDEEKKSVIVLYYDTVEALRAKGVPVDAHVGMPNPFPGQSENFCPPPE